MEDNVSWLPHSNNRFWIWKHRLNHICVTEALHRPQKPPNLVLYHGKFSQPYSQCPVWARAYVRSRLPSLVSIVLKTLHYYFRCCLQGRVLVITRMPSKITLTMLPSIFLHLSLCLTKCSVPSVASLGLPLPLLLPEHAERVAQECTLP